MVDSMENYKFDLGVKGLMTPSIKEFLNFFIIPFILITLRVILLREVYKMLVTL